MCVCVFVCFLSVFCSKFIFLLENKMNVLIKHKYFSVLKPLIFSHSVYCRNEAVCVYKFAVAVSAGE